MEATFIIKNKEFDLAVFEKIQALIQANPTGEVVIKMRSTKEKTLSPEFKNKIDKGIKDIEEGRGVSFSLEELSDYSL